MKNITVSLILAFVVVFSFGQSPCAQDSVWLGHPVTFEVNQPPLQCYPFHCEIADSCYSVQLPDSFSGDVYVASNFNTFELVALDSCRWVRLDTCALLVPLPPAYILRYVWPRRSALLVCGPTHTPVTVTLKTTLNTNPPLPQPIVDTDTICNTTQVIAPMRDDGKCWEYENYRFNMIDCGLPNKRYLFR